MCGYPTPADVAAALEGRAGVTPVLLWCELTGQSIDDVEFTPLWVQAELRRLGYGPTPAGFWWRNDLPTEKRERMEALFQELDEAYPDET